MRRGIRNPIKLKVRRYAARLIYINDYLAAFPGAKESEKIGETDLNEILLNSMPNIWIRQAYVQGFDFESINLKYVNMFEHIEISEYIYEGVVEPYYKKPTM